MENLMAARVQFLKDGYCDELRTGLKPVITGVALYERSSVLLSCVLRGAYQLSPCRQFDAARLSGDAETT